MKLQAKWNFKMATWSASSIQQAFICLQLCARHPAEKLPHRDLITLVLRNFNVVSTVSQLILYRMTNISKVTNMVDPGRNRYATWRNPSPARLPSSQGIRCIYSRMPGCWGSSPWMAKLLKWDDARSCVPAPTSITQIFGVNKHHVKVRGGSQKPMTDIWVNDRILNKLKSS